MLEHSGVAEGMYGALHVWLGGLRGGLAVTTVLIGTVVAACVGIIGASVTMLALIALPAMIKRGYDKSLAAGAVCGGGSLGILIPPQHHAGRLWTNGGALGGQTILWRFHPRLCPLRFILHLYHDPLSVSAEGCSASSPRGKTGALSGQVT